MPRTHDGSQCGLFAGLVITAVGLLHFTRPNLFEPLNRQLGFTEHTRRHVFINGTIETSIGLGFVSGKAKPITRIVSSGIQSSWPSMLFARRET